MLLRLPHSLHYPIQITKVEKQVGEPVAQNENLFMYTYTTKVTESTRYGEEDQEVDKSFVAHFQSSLEGKISGWRVWEGDTLAGPVEVCEIDEECLHTVQFQGMCTNCGKDMTRAQAGSDTTDADRAPIRMTHDTQHLTISQEEANRVDEEAKRRLLAGRKLSLVVDLDQTIIHAAVDPTIAEWQRDPENPNHDAVKDVRAFQLIDDGPGMRGCWYYIKLRPGLEEFLESISQLYELHIYTMGTRQYAQQIANIVDPDRKYFGERILSRDESGSMVAKNLERLFPVDTKMVVIIDDRGDVWKWSANLVRVTPFDFFVGIGDINSSFLPKRQEIQATPDPEGRKETITPDETKVDKAEQNGEHQANGVLEDGTSIIQNGTSALEQLVAMGGGDDPTVRELQSKGQEEIISSQLEDKPLLKMQMEQDEKDAAEEAAATDTLANGEMQVSTVTESDSGDSTDSSSSSVPKVKARHSILKNDDDELIYLEKSLTSVHTAFFAEYDRKRLAGKGGRVAALSGTRRAPPPSSDDGEDPVATDLLLIPDVKAVMPSMKMRVLSGVVIVFSGVLPLGTDIQNADISTWAKTFGARVVERVSREVTHVIAARPGTAKVKQAIKRKIKVVGTPWLIGSVQKWRKLDERPFLLEGAVRDEHDPFTGSGDGDQRMNTTANDFLLSSDEGETTGLDTETDEEGPARKRLKVDINAANRLAEISEEREDEEIFDDGSPVTIDQREWDDIDAELKEFMGSEADSESDNDSISSKLSVRSRRGKRKREDIDASSENGVENKSDADGETRKKTGVGESRLKSVANAASEKGSSGPNTPRNTEIEQRKIEQAQEDEEAEEEDSDDELARELERELEQADNDDEGFMGGHG